MMMVMMMVMVVVMRMSSLSSIPHLVLGRGRRVVSTGERTVYLTSRPPAGEADGVKNGAAIEERLEVLACGLDASGKRGD
jgi:hypothetical protein